MISDSALRILGRPLELSTNSSDKADAITVLGAPVGLGNSLAPVPAERIQVGAELWHRQLAPILCITGRAREAALMAKRAQELGVPTHALRIDDRARNTRENAYNSKALLKAENIQTVWLVTQPFHLRRACFWFRRAGPEPWPWWAENSIQYHRPRHAARWVTREYLAWARLGIGMVIGR